MTEPNPNFDAGARRVVMRAFEAALDGEDRHLLARLQELSDMQLLELAGRVDALLLGIRLQRKYRAAGWRGSSDGVVDGEA